MEQIQNKENIDNQNKSRSLLVCFALVNFSMAMINGILPCSLMELEKEVNMTYQQQGAIGSLAYMGTALISLISAPILTQIGDKKCLIYALALHSIFTLQFALSFHFILLCFSRIMQGILQCFFVVFIPVWINKHSPPNSSTIWMGIAQAAGPLGITFGYVIAGIFIYLLEGAINWRFSVIIQSIIEALILLLLIKVPTEAFHMPSERKFNLSQVAHILSSPLFMFVSLMLCSIFFVVTGIQFWSTTYLVQILNCNKKHVVYCFSTVSITAPLCGVFIGSALSDRYVKE